MSQKRGIPHAHICICLDKRDKLKRGVNNAETSDRIDQMIWGEIPVSWNGSYRPPGWRTADLSRKFRWLESTKLGEEEIHKVQDPEENNGFDGGCNVSIGNNHFPTNIPPQY